MNQILLCKEMRKSKYIEEGKAKKEERGERKQNVLKKQNTEEGKGERAKDEFLRNKLNLILECKNVLVIIYLIEATKILLKQ